MSHGWILTCALLLQPGLCLRLNRNAPGHHNNLELRSFFAIPDKEDVLELSPETLKKLSNHNYIFVGDSNERRAIFGALGPLGKTETFNFIGDPSSNDDNLIFTRGEAQEVKVTKVAKWNISAVYLFFPGTTTISPRPAGATSVLEESRSRKNFVWKHRDGTTVSYEEMVNTHWPKAVKQHLNEDHPTVLLTQSSVWDTLLSEEVYENTQSHEELQKFFPEKQREQARKFLKTWDFAAHVEKHLDMTQDSMAKSGVHLDQIILRTNPNCVHHEHYDAVFLEEQAIMIRNLVDSKQKMSPGLTLMDWRKSLDAQKANMCDKTEDANPYHYTPDGYKNFWNLFAATLH